MDVSLLCTIDCAREGSIIGRNTGQVLAGTTVVSVEGAAPNTDNYNLVTHVYLHSDVAHFARKAEKHGAANRWRRFHVARSVRERPQGEGERRRVVVLYYPYPRGSGAVVVFYHLAQFG